MHDTHPRIIAVQVKKLWLTVVFNTIINPGSVLNINNGALNYSCFTNQYRVNVNLAF